MSYLSPPMSLTVNLTSGSNLTVTLPIFDISGTFQVDWSNNTITTYTSLPASQTYASTGTYTIKISVRDNGSYIRSFGSTGWVGSAYLTAINDWGNLNGLTTLNFIGGPLINFSVPSTIPASVTSLQNMFSGASEFNQPIGDWDVSNVTNMSFMLRECLKFNGDISGWNVSNVTTMRKMFDNATSFTKDINKWNVSRVTDMREIAQRCGSAFRSNLSRWNVSNVTDLFNAFFSTTYSPLLYSNDLIGWSSLPSLKSGVALSGSVNLFDYAIPAYNLLRNKYNWTIFISGSATQTFIPYTGNAMIFSLKFDTVGSSVTLPFSGGTSPIFSVDWGDSTTSKNLLTHTYDGSGTYIIQFTPITNSFTTFGSSSWATANYITGIHAWGNITGLTTLTYIGGAALTTVPTTLPTTVTNMSNMFNGASTFNQAISTWDVSGVQNMNGMFQNALDFNEDLSPWNIKSVTTMQNMFTGATAFSTLNYSSLLIAWAALPSLKTNVYLDFNSNASINNNALPAFLKLTSTPINWKITPDFTPPPPFYRMIQSLYSDNSLVYYKPHSLSASIGSTVRNSRVVSKRT